LRAGSKVSLKRRVYVCLLNRYFTSNRFLALDHPSEFPPESILTAGNQWAKIAKARIFADLDDLSLEKLMVRPVMRIHTTNGSANWLSLT
jgi:hypothetical protein